MANNCMYVHQPSERDERNTNLPRLAMREEVKLEAAMEKATSWPRSSTSSRPHRSFPLNSMRPSTEASDQISCRSKIYTPANKEEDQ